MKRKTCRERVKVDLKATRRSVALRDHMRRAWAIGRCWECGRCPKWIAKLPEAPRLTEWTLMPPPR